MGPSAASRKLPGCGSPQSDAEAARPVSWKNRVDRSPRPGRGGMVESRLKLRAKPSPFDEVRETQGRGG